MPAASRSGRPTIRTVAAAAGVSVATVSYVLNGRDLVDKRIKITPETRQRVLSTAQELGYTPNQSARGMSRGQTDQICLITASFSSPWVQAMVVAIRSVSTRLNKTGLVLLDPDWYEFLSRRGADAAVFESGPSTPEDYAHIRELARKGTHIIVLGGDLEPDGFDVIKRDLHPGLDDAVDLLFSRNDRVGLLSVPHGVQGEITRAYLAAQGSDADPRLIRKVNANREDAYWAAMDLLDSPDRPTAILASNDLSALSALRAAHRLHIDVPDQLEIIGYGNTPEGQRADPSLTSLGADDPAHLVTDLLTQRLTGGSPTDGRSHVLKFTLHQRGTTR